MASLTAIAFNLFETIGFVQPCMEVMVRETTECSVGLQPLRMRWVHELDSNGRRVTRIQWIEDKQREEVVGCCCPMSMRTEISWDSAKDSKNQ
jgi:hypothetical protein